MKKSLKLSFCIWNYILMFILWIPLIPLVHSAERIDDMKMELALKAFNQGNFAEAIEIYEAAAHFYKTEKNILKHTEALFRAADGYVGLGRYSDALERLQTLLSMADSEQNQEQQIMILERIGQVYQFIGELDQSRYYLETGLNMIQPLELPGLRAALLNTMGNLYFIEKDYKNAFKSYMSCIELCEKSGDDSLCARAYVNSARTNIEDGQNNAALPLLKTALYKAENLPDTHDKIYTMTTAGQVLRRLPRSDETLQMTYTAFKSAQAAAERIEDLAGASYALGFIGSLYEDDKRLDEALQYTRRAVFYAQKANFHQSLYRWQWQTGRILKNMGDIDGAIIAYRLAVQSLEILRKNMDVGCNRGNCVSFKEYVVPVYFELADVLLKRSAYRYDPEQIDLLEARKTVEQLKAAELQDYFQDECVTAQKTKITGIENFTIYNTAAIYPIILQDRLELLVSFSSGMKQFTVPVSAKELTDDVTRFRIKLEQPDSRFIAYSERLYNYLIRPLSDELAANKVDTLIFIPDGALRTIPMSALYDGKNFLISRYAVAVTPGLNLVEPHPIRRSGIRLLLNGLTQSVQGFSPLPNVSYELEKIGQIYEGTVLRDENFTVSELENALGFTPYSIVHIASHGQFDRDPKKTFLLTHDGRLTIDRLEILIGLSEFRNEPVELLTLSACQTAVGDDRAALGLAGVAVKAGARSALATLWFVNDEATSRLITDFYMRLKDPSVTKAHALRHAQLSLIETEKFHHPAYWAPFLLIGNWL